MDACGIALWVADNIKYAYKQILAFLISVFLCQDLRRLVLDFALEICGYCGDKNF